MSGGRAPASVLVLSEDRSEDAIPTIQALLRHMLAHVNPNSPVDALLLEPFEDSLASKVVFGNVWKSAKGTAPAITVRLAQRLARQILQGGFVVHHVDGDTTWADRASSENVGAYERVIASKVRALLLAQRPEGKARKLTPLEADEAMKRLIVLMPFWCIEAWLFQNTAEARQHCADESHGCRARLDDWDADRTRLDEERTPKKLLCFGSSRNLALARGDFPSGHILAARTSYYAAVERLRSCEALVVALAAY